MTTKLYLHAAATGNTGTLPTGKHSSLTDAQSTVPTGKNTQRAMTATIGVSQASQSWSSLGSTSAQATLVGMWESVPMTAQTLPTGTWTLSYASSESNASSNYQTTFCLYTWRPGTGAVVSTLWDHLLSGVEPGTTQTAATIVTASVTGTAVLAGDILVLEVWRDATVQGTTTSRTNTFFYDGTTEADTTSCASFLICNGGTISFPVSVNVTGAAAAVTVAAPAGVSEGDAAVTGVAAPVTVAAPAGVSEGDAAVTGVAASVTVASPAGVAAGGGGSATPALVNGPTIGHTLTVTIPSTTAGNCLVVVVSAWVPNAAVTGMTLGGSAGNFGAVATVGNTGDARVEIWADPNCAGGQTSVVVAGIPSGSVTTGSGAIVVYEFSGLAGTLGGLLDQTHSAGHLFNATWSSGTTGATSQAVELWVGGACMGSGGGGITTYPASPWVNDHSAGTNNELAGYQITTSAGTAVYNGTTSASAFWAALVVTLLPAAGGAGANVTGVAAAVTAAAGTGVFDGDAAVTGAAASVTAACPAGVPAGAGGVTGTSAPVTVVAPAGAPKSGQNLTGTAAAVTVAAPAGVAAGTSPNANVTGIAAPVTAASPAGTPSGSGAVTGVAAPVSVASPAGALKSDQNLTGQAAPVTVASPAGAPHSSNAVTGTAATVTVAGGAGVASCPVSVTGTAAPVTVASPAGVLSAAANITGVAAAVTVAAPAGVAAGAGGITRVNTVSITARAATTSATATIPGGTGILAGDLLFICASSNGTHVLNGMAVQDSVNATVFTKVLEKQAGGGSAFYQSTHVFVTPLNIADGSTVTLTGYAAATACALALDVFRGASATVDQAAVGTTNATSTTPAGPPLGGNASAGSLVLTTCSTGATGTTQAAGSPFTAGSTQAVSPGTGIGFLLSAPGGSTEASTWTLGITSVSATQTVSYRPAGGASANVTGVAAAVTVTAPAGALEGDQNLTGAAAPVTVASPAGAASSAANVAGVAAAVTVASPAGVAASSANVAGVAAPVTVAGGAGVATAGGAANVTGVAAPVTVASPAGTPSSAAATAGASAPVTVAAPAGVFAGSANVTGVAGAVTVASPAGAVTAAANITGVGAPVTVAGGTGVASAGGAANITGVAAAVTVASPAGVPHAAANLTGTAAPVTVAGGQGVAGSPVNVTGVAAHVTAASPAGATATTASVTGTAAPVLAAASAGALAAAATTAGHAALVTVAAAAGVPFGALPFTIGALSAADKPGSVLTGTAASNTLTASTAAPGALTATDQRTGGPG